MWTLLVFCWLVITALMNAVPILGAVVNMLTLPAFLMSFMCMCEELRHGRPLRPDLLLAGFRTRLRELLVLGALNLAFMSAILLLFWLIDGGSLLESLRSASRAARPSEEDVIRIYKGVAVLLFISAPLVAALWFAPLLAAWNAMSPAKSMFYSFFACLRNWRAFAVYSVALFAMLFALGLVLAIVALVFRVPPNSIGFNLAAALVLLPTMFASFYVAYRDIFPEDERAQPAPEAVAEA
jgi:hypothetical protein